MVDLIPTPKFTFVQVKRGFEITDTALKGTFSRKDIHQVTVGLALEPTGAVALATCRDLCFQVWQPPRGGKLREAAWEC